MLLRGLRSAVTKLSQEVSRPGQVALDFGAGSRPYDGLFIERGVQYLGADLQGADILIRPDGRLSMADDSADLLLSFQVLEHVRDLATYFSEAHRVLRPDGQMILSTHGTWLYHPHPEDHRRWTKAGLISEIETHGFEVLECHSVVGPLAWTTMLRLTGFAFVLRRIPFIGRALAAGLAIMMNGRARLEDAITPAAFADDNACVYVTLSRPRPGPS
jgi:SAM-dependent methyltransferase